MTDAAEWAAEHAVEVQGHRVDSAVDRVRAAGLTPRVVEPGALVTLEYRPDRVTLEQDATGLVTAVRPG